MSAGAQYGNLARRIADLEREFSDFSYQSSHDAVAPFRHINGYATLLNDALARNDPGQAARFSALIIKAAEECQQRIDNLLLYSRAQGASMTLVVCDVDQLIGLARLRQSPLLAAKGIRLNAGRLGTVKADAALFGRALEHLLRAWALSLAPCEQGYTMEIDPVASDTWRMAFACDGPPLSEADVGRAFAIRLAEPASQERGSWSIDLAIARRIFRRHDGDVAFVPFGDGVRLEAWVPATTEVRDE